MTEIRKRAMPTEVELKDGILIAQFVPWDRPAKVVDPLPGGRLDVYMEGFRRSAFDAQIQSKEPGVVRRIQFQDQHEGGLGKFGHTQRLVAGDGGLIGEVKLFRSKIPDVEDLIDMGVDQVSIEYFEKRGGTTIDDERTRWRTNAHLVAVALESQGAYGEDAKVLMMREDREAEAAEQEAAEAAQRELEEIDRFLQEEKDRWASLQST